MSDSQFKAFKLPVASALDADAPVFHNNCLFSIEQPNIRRRTVGIGERANGCSS